MVRNVFQVMQDSAFHHLIGAAAGLDSVQIVTF